MRLATLPDGSRDGRLVVVSSDLKRAIAAESVARTLQDALERWPEVERGLQGLALMLERAELKGNYSFEATGLIAPLPRAWQWLDGSAFASHGELMQMAFGLPPIVSERPLMYQGLSHQFFAGSADVPLPSEADGIDFEGEFAVITDEVPMGTNAADALAHVRLLILVNDWSLRTIGVAEMKTGFGWVQAKPACSIAPVAVTPDELGPAWRKGRVCLPLKVSLNGESFGKPNGAAMEVGFDVLIAHAARTRSLCAGTIIGSGTVSNHNAAEVGSACISERRALEKIASGESLTNFLKFGDRVRMECLDADGQSLFGPIDQRIIEATRGEAKEG